jgi:propane monooxygenase reductase subunit
MFTIKLLPTERSFVCAENETILNAAFRVGIRLPHGCRQGGCGSCKARIVEGEVDDPDASTAALMDFERTSGLTLLCSAYPASDVVIWIEGLEEAEGVPQPSEFQAAVTEIIDLAPGIVLVTMTTENPLQFKAGQYIELQVPQTDEWRAYSLANPPSQSNRLELLIKLAPGGLFSSYLAAGRLRQGNRLSVRGPFGNFCMRESARTILFVAGGSGLGPVLSMLREMAASERTPARSVRLLYGARTRKDLCYVEDLRLYEKTFADLKYIPVLSEANDDPDWRGERGFVTGAIAKWAENGNVQAYLCGPPPMIDAGLLELARLGVPETEISFDKFLSKADISSRKI